MPLRALVPYPSPPIPDRGGIVSADPVRGGEWSAMALMSNFLLGGGGWLVPACGINKTATIGTTKTYRFTVWPRYQATHRIWVIRVEGVIGVAAATITFTDPSGGTSSWTATASTAVDSAQPFLHTETITSRVSVATPVSVTIATATSSAIHRSIACFEVPRPELASNALDYGVDLSTFLGFPIKQGATGKSVGGVVASTAQALAVAKRTHFQFARDTGDVVWTTSAAYTAGLGGSPVILERKIYRGETKAAVPFYVYTRSGAGSTGNVRITMTNGASATIAVPAADAGTWRSTTVDVNIEDLTTINGFGAAAPDYATIEIQRTAGANSVGFESVSIGPRAT